MRSAFVLLLAIAILVASACGEREDAVETGGAVEETAAHGTVAEPVRAASTGTASKPGDMMPAYTASDLAGGTWALENEKGVTLLNLWATWCNPCRYEIPALIELQKDYGEQGLQVVGVSMDRRGMEQQISSFVQASGINYKIVHDPDARLADVFDTTIIPTTALIDRDGKVVWYHAGIVTLDDAELLEALKQALGVEPAA